MFENIFQIAGDVAGICAGAVVSSIATEAVSTTVSNLTPFKKVVFTLGVWSLATAAIEIVRPHITAIFQDLYNVFANMRVEIKNAVQQAQAQN